MGLRSLLRDWLNRALGRGTGDGTDTDDATTEEAFAYECEVCGTPVDSPEDACPLCRSTAIVPEGSSKRSPPAELDHVRQTRERTDDAADALSGVRRSGVDVLANHGDRWERLDDGFRVERADGSTTVVDSEERLTAVLRAEYGEE
jgi:hypothetical protein